MAKQIQPRRGRRKDADLNTIKVHELARKYCIEQVLLHKPELSIHDAIGAADEMLRFIVGKWIGDVTMVDLSKGDDGLPTLAPRSRFAEGNVVL